MRCKMPPSLIHSPVEAFLFPLPLLLPTSECSHPPTSPFLRFIGTPLESSRGEQRPLVRHCKLKRNREEMLVSVCSSCKEGRELIQLLWGGGRWMDSCREVMAGGGVLEEAVPAMRKIWIPVCKTNWSPVCGRSRGACGEKCAERDARKQEKEDRAGL